MTPEHSELSAKQVMAALSTVQEPELGRDLVTLGMIKELEVADGRVDFTIELTTPACPLKGQIEREARLAVEAVPGVQRVDIRFTANVRDDGRARGLVQLPIRNAVAVASGKGGVGKTTVAVNLAVALARAGARVGLLDADIYGPNVPLMMGVGEMPEPREGRLIPAQAHGVRVMSIGFLVPPGQPLIWRGPMLHSAIRQFIADVEWGELDYLVIDLPPGTGDVQLTLVQKIPLSGAVIVTTPQDVALADAIKGIQMFQEVKTPILGIVENMSFYVCPHCGEQSEIFGFGGGERTAERYDVPLLGRIPLDTAIRQGGDIGHPIVVSEPESPPAEAFADAARQCARRLAIDAAEKPRRPTIMLKQAR